MTESMSLDEYQKKYGRSIKSAQSKKRGNKGEEMAQSALRHYGVRMVEEIATPFVITGKRKGGWVRIKRKKKVSGDIRGILGDGSGKRVLAEVKTTGKDRILWSALKDHQVQALDENNRLGGISLLIVIFMSAGAYVLRWPVSGFLPRTSINIQDAIDKQWDGEG